MKHVTVMCSPSSSGAAEIMEGGCGAAATSTAGSASRSAGACGAALPWGAASGRSCPGAVWVAVWLAEATAFSAGIPSAQKTIGLFLGILMQRMLWAMHAQ